MIDILTYQDLVALGEDEQKRMAFILTVIEEHKRSDCFKVAQEAELYYKHQNPTIMKYQKFVHNQAGQKVPDIWSPNNKIASNWYNYFTTQSVQYLLGNGISFAKPETLEKLGKKFEKNIQAMATYAKNAGVCYGFWNVDHLEVFPVIDSENTVGFATLKDENNGMVRVGIRFWQLDEDKPLNVTLYEESGISTYKKPYEKPMEFVGKTTYIRNRNFVEKTGETVGYTDKENYSSLPIFPMYNTHKQSDLIGNQNTIDAYDLIMSGLINNVDEGEFIYWILKNFGGMNEIDDAKFVEQLKLTHVAHANDGDEGSSVEAHKTEIPYNASQVSLELLEKQLYKDFMALKVEDISASSVTNDQIQAAYEPLNQKTDAFEYQVTDFIETLLEFLGIDDSPTYTRSQMSNRSETLQDVLSASEYLDTEYMTKKILTLLGDADKAEEVLQKIQGEELDRFEDESEDVPVDEEVSDEEMEEEIDDESDESDEDIDVSAESAQLDEKYLTEYANDVLSMLGDLVGEEVEAFEEIGSPAEGEDNNSYLNDFSKQIMEMLDGLLKESENNG